MRQPPVITPPLSHYVDMLRTRQPFALARYGDGEWLTILGYVGKRNSNGCTFTPELRDDLRRVLRNQYPYEHGILRISRRKLGNKIAAWLSENSVQIEWVLGDVMLESSLRGELFPLVEQLREYRILYVGNQRLRGLSEAGFFDYVAYVQPPPRNAHQAKAEILGQVRAAIEQHGVDLIGWSSGLASKVFIDDIYADYPEVTQIDFGSLWDGYFKPLGHVNPLGSRSYIRKGQHNFKALLRQNTGVA